MAPLLLPLLLLLLHPTHGTIFHAYPASNTTSPFCACVQKLKAPGDECRLHAGRYFVGPDRCSLSGVHGTASSPLVVASAGDGPVVIDGTLPVGGAAAQPTWTETEDGLWSTPVGHDDDVLQLFVDGELQVLARYPNALWSDKSVFYAVENWFRSTTPGVHNLATGEGLLRDTGKCADPSTCCAKCNTHDLAASGVDATGALAVLELWSCDTGVERILRHDAGGDQGAGGGAGVLHYNATWVGLCDTYRGGDGRYFLQGARSLLDGPEEWLLSKTTTTSNEILVAKRPRAGAKVTGRVSDYALMVTDTTWLVVANLSFHATTLSASGGTIGNITLSSLEFNYSAVSRRAVNDTSPPVGLTAWVDTTAADTTSTPTPQHTPQHTPLARPRPPPTPPSGLVIEDVVVRYSDGPAMMVSGLKTTMKDCLFEWNDWTTVGGSWPEGVPRHGKAHRATTVWVDDDAGVRLQYLTFRNNGAAQSINAGGNVQPGCAAPLVEMCSFSSQLAIQDDGSFVEGGGARSTTYIRNWATDSGKGGLRWDGYVGRCKAWWCVVSCVVLSVEIYKGRYTL